MALPKKIVLCIKNSIEFKYNFQSINQSHDYILFSSKCVIHVWSYFFIFYCPCRILYLLPIYSVQQVTGSAVKAVYPAVV